jgi:hypothetical protein
VPLYLDVRATDKGGLLAPSVTVRDESGQAQNVQLLESSVRGREVLLVAHGFNVTRAGGLSRIAWWEERLQLPAVQVVGILWPGDSAFIPAIDYPIEGNEAMGAGDLLGPFIDTHLASSPSISFASHSLGARVVLQTIRRMRTKVQSLTMMAGAIDNTCLVDEYKDAVTEQKVGKISILASRSDDVLQLAFPLGNFLAGIVSAGHPYIREALGREGPASPLPNRPLPNWQIPDAWDYGHGDYFGTAAAQGSLIPALTGFPGPNAPKPIPPDDFKPAWSAAFAASRR